MVNEMSVNATVLFQSPQQEIASLIVDRISRSSSTSIVTGFATPGGLATIGTPLRASPYRLKELVVGAATYPAFEVLDELISLGVPTDRLRVHLGHTVETGGRKNPFARYHPMLHSKVYLMELPNSTASAFIGSHNVTSFALCGLNGEAAILLEGPSRSREFDEIRQHIEMARDQAVVYSPALKEAYAWWSREFIDGLKATVGLPRDWTTVRTILIFASAKAGDRPKAGDQLYFEIPAGIQQIVSLKTEVHLFLFSTLPSNPFEALTLAASADAQFTCRTLGAENRQGNREVIANWRIEPTPLPALEPVPSGVYRPMPPSGMQQVRAEIEATNVATLEYLFERESVGWDPEFSHSDQVLRPPKTDNQVTLAESQGNTHLEHGWKLVKGLRPRVGFAKEVDQAALKLAAPESGSFILVSLRRRRRGESQRKLEDL
jgi:hypothetical protein